MAGNETFIRIVVRAALQEILEAETLDESLASGPSMPRLKSRMFRLFTE